MAQLIDTLISGDLRVTGTAYGNQSVAAMSSGTTGSPVTVASTGSQPLQTDPNILIYNSDTENYIRAKQGASTIDLDAVSGQVGLWAKATSGTSAAWLCYRDANGNVFNGNAVSSDYPSGFIAKNSFTWGTLGGSDYTHVTDWAAENGSEIAFAANGGRLYAQIDGYFYQNEGRQRVLDTSDVSNGNPTLSWGNGSTVGTVGGTNLTLNMPAYPNQVYQGADNSSVSTDYEILFSGSADNTSRTEQTKKSTKLTFQPQTGALFITGDSGLSVKTGSGTTLKQSLYTSGGMSIYAGTGDAKVTLTKDGLYCGAGGVSVSGSVTSASVTASGNITANGKFIGNVQGSCTGSSGSCTGNAATSSSCTGNSATATKASRGYGLTAGSGTGNYAFKLFEMIGSDSSSNMTWSGRIVIQDGELQPDMFDLTIMQRNARMRAIISNISIAYDGGADYWSYVLRAYYVSTNFIVYGVEKDGSTSYLSGRWPRVYVYPLIEPTGGTLTYHMQAGTSIAPSTYAASWLYSMRPNSTGSIIRWNEVYS